MATPLVLYPRFLDKTNFLRIQTCGPGTYRTLLQSPHDPVPELGLALLWRTAAGGTLHRSPVPIYPLGLDNTNFPWVLTPDGAKRATIPTTCTWSHTGILTSGLATWWSELRLDTWWPPSLGILTPRLRSCISGFSIKQIFSEYRPADPVLTGPFYNPHMVPSLNFAWLFCGISLLGAPGTGLLCPFTPWGLIKRIFPEY